MKIYFVTKMGAYTSSQLVFEAEDLHQLCVDILHCLQPLPGSEYTDAQVIKLLTDKDLWENMNYYLISIYDPVTKKLTELVKDA